MKFDPSERVPVYILAGGKSRRFGSDKARAPVDGVPLIVRIAECCVPLARRIIVVAAEKGRYDDLGLRTIGDVVPSRGPLGGLLTALDDAREDDWIFVTACDWTGIRSQWIRELLERRTEAASAVVFYSDRYEPLFAVYRTAIRGAVAARIERGALAVHELLESLDTIVVPAPAGWGEAANLNRPPRGGRSGHTNVAESEEHG